MEKQNNNHVNKDPTIPHHHHGFDFLAMFSHASQFLTDTMLHIFAVNLFHELSKALEVLSDPKAKAAYDAVLKAKERARLRTQALDEKRKKFKQGIK